MKEAFISQIRVTVVGVNQIQRSIRKNSDMGVMSVLKLLLKTKVKCAVFLCELVQPCN